MPQHGTTNKEDRVVSGDFMEFFYEFIWPEFDIFQA